MELVPGRGLDELRHLTCARIIEIGTQICDALAYAHDQGFVHRDLKPGNVLIEKRGFKYFAKLADFGLARPRGVNNLPHESNTAGTVYYLAPEVIAGQLPDVASDLYALGALLYELLTGRVPFSDFIDDQAIFAQHLNESVSPPSHSRADVPSALEALVLRLLAKDPRARYASAQAVRAALEQIQLTRANTSTPGNLPDALPALNGCEQELTQIEGLLAAHQSVTLLNNDPALALALGAKLRAQFADGIWQADLSAVREPAQALPVVASLLGVHSGPDRPLTVTLIESLREKNLLLILHHCDHVLYACAQLVETLVHTCPDLYILVASPQPLNIPDEICYPA
jgi:non-specific serine/threonine protein kinase